jgi:outer membrane protein OmpA-like peptidoglycan-associated protein
LAGVFSFQEANMGKCLTIATVIVVLAAESQASTVAQKKYVYMYGAARDTRSDQEYVICVEPPRPPLVPELKPPPLAIRFGDLAFTPALNSTLLPGAAKTGSRSRPCEYRQEKTVLFGFDSAKIEAGSELILLADALGKDPSVTGIRLRGFTCDLGPGEYNDRLAMRRAVAVATILGKAGLKLDQVSGEGKCCYVPGERRLSRRVEISVMRSSREENSNAK